MATIVSFHAHPDDEAIATGGTLARAAAEGHRVIVVVATHGEEGEVETGFLSAGETLHERRLEETHAAAMILGVARVQFLGYRDSGMMGTDANDHPDAFWQAPPEEAADRLAEILVEERADVLTVYDKNGGYGHPDHIQVHRVGHRAAQIAGTARVFEATMNRDEIRRSMEAARAAGEDIGPDDGEDRSESIGVPDADITTVVDVRPYIDTKRRAMQAHASQISDSSWFLKMPDDAFRDTFGREWFTRVQPAFEGNPVADRETWILE
jgi:LmbE family N-acetylglucosaminyl deacetylase